MRLSQYILPTLKEDPSDAVVLSHRLMIRAGLIRKESAGMYIYLPLGWRALRKIIGIVRGEMDKAGALEFLMPELTSSDLWRESGRWDAMGPEMFRIRDRNGIEYALAPTHEEAFTGVMRNLISSYRDLPKNVYQINTKFRDEIRPRFGVIRSKEFIMKDAYSFDMDEKGLEYSYQVMRKTYRRIFERCGLDTIPVEADTGAMGGRDSEEFMVASEVGEEVLLLCGSCGYRANREKAGYKRKDTKSGEKLKGLAEVVTPDVKTIDDLVKFFKCAAERLLKSIIYVADGRPVMAVVTGDRGINEQKLARAAGASSLELAPETVVEEVTGAPVGFAGPVTKKDIRILYDLSVKNVVNGITGANKKDLHFEGVNPGRDFSIKEEADISFAEEGDACPQCGSAMSSKKGIEVGHIFKLEYKYTRSMNVTVLSEEGVAVTPIMGTYGIGINRTMAAIVEQHNDEKGIVWPRSVAPFEVHLVRLGKGEMEIRDTDAIYDMLLKEGFEVLYDDRTASPGYKFADADLIGLPIRVTIGKHYFRNGEVEVKQRKETQVHKIEKDGLIDLITALLSVS